MDAVDLIVERARRDFEEGLAHSREQIRANHSRLVSIPLDALLTGAVAALDLRDRIDEDVRFLCSLSRDVTDGADAVEVAREQLPRVLRLKQLAIIARERDPAFERVLELCHENFARRLPDLGRMVSVDSPASYDELVRRAFPDRAHVERIIAENRAFTLALVDHIEANPHILRAPKSLVPRVAHTARSMIEWIVAKVAVGIEEIYDFDPAV